MKFYLAPLEGITGYVFRNVYHACFGNMDKYFIPFIMPNQNRCLSPKELRDVSPEHNKGMVAVPQILTNCPEHFIKTACLLKQMGYGEINLNLGCPSKTVVSKGRGSGFLAHTTRLGQFLDEIFEKCDIRISIKTRLGVQMPDEFEELLEMYNRFPLAELIIHPRTQKDLYKNAPDWEAFGNALKNSKNPVCYNGDIFSRQDYKRFTAAFPDVGSMMLGRGILKNAGLVGAIQENKAVCKEPLRAFHDMLYEAYREVLSGDKTVLFKMKELWCYMIDSFTDNKKYWKRIKKAERLDTYEAAVYALFREQEVIS